MNLIITSRPAAVSAFAAVALTVVLTGCGGTAATDRGATTTRDRGAHHPARTTGAMVPVTAAAVPDPAPQATEPTAPPRRQLREDDATRVDFPGAAAVLDDGSSASSDGTSLFVTTAAEERYSVALPSAAEGWISQVLVDLGDAGSGYLVTQSGGEYLQTSLAVLHDGVLTLVAPEGDVPFGDSADDDGPVVRTFTTGGGAHLLTRVGADDVYEWSVRGTTLVPTLVS